MKIYSLCLLFIVSSAYAEMPSSLDVPRPPGPLFSFGHNVAPKGAFYWVETLYHLATKKGQFTGVRSSFLYGFTDRFSALIRVPVALRFSKDCLATSGIEDLMVQMEYGFFRRLNEHSFTQATVLMNTFFPTGTRTKRPPLGVGGPTVLLGLTAEQTTSHWYIYTSQGLLLPSRMAGQRLGVTYFGDIGIGQMLSNAWGLHGVVLLEANVIVAGQRIARNVVEKNSGGVVVFLGPVVRIAGKGLTVRTGVQFPVSQDLDRNQDPAKYRVSFSVAYEF